MELKDLLAVIGFAILCIFGTLQDEQNKNLINVPVGDLEFYKPKKYYIGIVVGVLIIVAAIIIAIIT